MSRSKYKGPFFKVRLINFKRKYIKSAVQVEYTNSEQLYFI